MAWALIIAACVWFGLGTIFVLSLVCAARRRMPSPGPSRHNATVIPAMDSAQSEQIVSKESRDFVPAQNEIHELVADRVPS
jgi:hypothetical protein